ncbi:MAG: 16S rRNA (cytosine(967)-C(5))-methyltransferase RsmB [Chthoniobacterales bacterium]|nr:16S rRNA (cytosine(967)-C(5))-methyltransferase RsmB [Chthoniobacterales bacterium]
MAPASARGLALAALEEWRHGHRFADAILRELLNRGSLSGSDRGFATELFYGVLRNLTLLDFWLANLRSASLDDRSRDLLRIGLYQLFCLRIPDHAAVFETVKLASKNSRSLVNAVLRNALRRADELQNKTHSAELAIQTSHPQFLVERWRKAFGADATSTLCRWDNHPAPMYARVNRLKIPVEQFLAADATREFAPKSSNFVRVSNIPHDALERGECYIQDPSTSIACELLDPKPGDIVLDACAAPGGKTGYLAELMQNRGELVACDCDLDRIKVLGSNLRRLGVTISQLIQQNWSAANVTAELRGRQFDRILIDAPCTNSGVMRRRVDVRWRLRPEDFARMAAAQCAIVEAVVPLLKPGGTVVYSTCSIDAEENEGVLQRLLSVFPWLQMEAQQSVLPFRDDIDGAFAARLTRDPNE